MTGALVLGSDYRGLGAVQSLGRQGIDVWVVHESRGVADVSRYARRTIRFPTGADDSKVDFLLELGRRHALEGWVLFPTSDKIAAICARNRDVLGAVFRPTTPPWEVYRYAHDKQLTERLAAEIGVPSPRMWELGLAGAADIDCRFPAILKPTVKEERNALTVEKAWRVEDRAELAARYAAALQLLPADQIMLQELIPGDGTNQLSFAALACDGEVICSVVARRTRQIPMDIGRVSTFVETIDDADVRSLGRRVVARLSYTGLVEVEFKRDPRTGEAKLLDINARLWGWHTLGRRAGVDFSYLLYRLACGDRPDDREGAAGVRWMWPAGDVPTAALEIVRGRLRLGDYLESFRGPIDFATITVDDPLPGFLEMPFQAAARLRRPNSLNRAEGPPRSPVFPSSEGRRPRRRSGTALRR